MDVQTELSNTKEISGENIANSSADASELLKNGILVETNKGLICMALSDTVSSNLNLTAEDLQTMASELFTQQVLTVDSAACLPPKAAVPYEAEGEKPAESPVGAAPHRKQERSALSLTSLQSSLEDNVVTLLPVIDECEEHMGEANPPQPKPADLLGVQARLKPMSVPHLTLAALAKRRGGWPKGRKRKPELLNLPPKAPATGYTLFLNEKRQLYKDRHLAFHEITKAVGHEWSSLTLNEKKPYLMRAEEEKRRYREELKVYRQSEAYRTYLAKKRKKRVQYNVLSESDMDATDEIDDEDNEELYCRACDHWFHSLHNKREHLLGRQHSEAMAGDMTKELASLKASSSSASFSTSFDESSLDGTPATGTEAGTGQVTDAITILITNVSKREREIKLLEQRLQGMAGKNKAFQQEMFALNIKENKLKEELLSLKEDEKSIEEQLFQLWSVPSMFIMTNLENLHSATPESSEYSLSDILPE